MGELTPVAENLWVSDHPLRVGGMPFGTRMTVIRLDSGELLVHSPVPVDDELGAKVDELGAVAHIVAPNRYHHLYAGDWQARYPAARLYGAPGLASKRSDLTFDAELGNIAEPGWHDELAQQLFGGAPKLGEVVFFHRPTSTLLVTDLAFNFGRGGNWIHRTYLRLSRCHQCFGQSLLIKMLVKDRAAARQAVELILRWRFERIIMAHGGVLETGGREAFKRIFEWLPPGETLGSGAEIDPRVVAQQESG